MQKFAFVSTHNFKVALNAKKCSTAQKNVVNSIGLVFLLKIFFLFFFCLGIIIIACYVLQNNKNVNQLMMTNLLCSQLEENLKNLRL